jgi:hypothetical protein
MLNNFALWFISGFLSMLLWEVPPVDDGYSFPEKNEGINPVFHHHGCFANLFLSDTHFLKSLTQRTIC